MYNGLEDGYTGRDDIEYLPTGQPLFAAMHHGTRLEVGGSIYRPHGLLAEIFSRERKVDPCVNRALSLRFGAHSHSLHLFFFSPLLNRIHKKEKENEMKWRSV